ncbi:MAG TPA: glycosyltransferase family 39 protein [Chthoniobacteraceae bacterium]|nr:glycosyltransferase family 39 protein [Chthoniobacteraceae bacterium]
MTARRLLLAFLAALTLLRLLIIGQIELSPDEAYYFQWSERLDWSYFSKGPGVATAMWLSTNLFGISEFGVRVLSPLLALGTSLLMLSFARRLYGESVAIWTVLMINVIPIFSVGGLVLTIDPLSIFFWMAALYTVWLALERSPDFSLWWPATGALIGLGFLAKYTNAMQLLSILLLLAVTPKYRRELGRRGFYTMLGTFLVFTAPPIIWNAQHDWITLHHLTARGGLGTAAKFDPMEFLAFLGAHFGVYSPILFGGMLVAIFWSWKRVAVYFKSRFLLAFTLPLFALYLALSFKQAGEANWTAPATLSLGLLAVALWHDRAQEHRWARRIAFAGLLVAFAMSLVTVDTELPRRLGIPLSYDLDPSARLRGWRSASEKLEEVRNEFEAAHGQPVFLIANKYGTAASLAFYLRDRRAQGPGHPPIYVPESAFPENQYFFWPRYDENVEAPAGNNPEQTYYTEEGGSNPFLGRTALYVTDRAEERPPSSIKRGFERVEMIRCIDFSRRGFPLRQLRVFACYNYRQVSL